MPIQNIIYIIILLLSSDETCYALSVGRKRFQPTEENNLRRMIKMMMNNDKTFMNIAIMLAEDTGAPELRNPLNSGMKAKSWLNRLFGRKNREQ